jgi:hypothetical protein
MAGKGPAINAGFRAEFTMSPFASMLQPLFVFYPSPACQTPRTGPRSVERSGRMYMDSAASEQISSSPQASAAWTARQKEYLLRVRHFAAHFMRSPDQLAEGNRKSTRNK